MNSLQKQPSKRIVSKGEYLKVQTKRGLLWAQAVAIALPALIIVNNILDRAHSHNIASKALLVFVLLFTNPLAHWFTERYKKFYTLSSLLFH